MSEAQSELRSTRGFLTTDPRAGTVALGVEEEAIPNVVRMGKKACP
jgi:hypothetical protein